jgi:hypothetical protein
MSMGNRNQKKEWTPHNTFKGREDEFMEQIIPRIEFGTPLSEICRDEGMPSPTTVYEWMKGESKEAKARAERFARARRIGYDAIAEDCLRIADDGENDYMESLDSVGGVAYKLNGENVQRSKLRVETRLKLLAKWDPKYRDAVGVDHSGDVGLTVQVLRLADGLQEPQEGAEGEG